MLYFFNKKSSNLLSICKSRNDALLYLQIAGKFDVDCDEFLFEAIKIYNIFIENDPNKFPSIMN